MAEVRSARPLPTFRLEAGATDGERRLTEAAMQVVMVHTFVGGWDGGVQMAAAIDALFAECKPFLVQRDARQLVLL